MSAEAIQIWGSTAALSRAAKLCLDPIAEGFEFTGWAVAFPDGRYIAEYRPFQPSAGFRKTDRPERAMVVMPDDMRSVTWLARRTEGHVAEVWDSAEERLIVWGDQIPECRRKGYAL